MKKVYCLYIVIFFFLPFANSQSRIVHWVHGFGANTSAWFPVVVASEQGSGATFPARNIASNNVTYTGPNIAVNTLSDAGAELRMRMRDFLTNYAGGIGTPRAENSFVISHSQGGLVSRWTTDISIPTSGISNNLKHYGGLVTFGTPHAGAKIATSRYNGDLDVFLNQGCNDLGGAIIADATSNLSFGDFGDFLNAPLKVSRVADNLKSSICNSFFSKEVNGSPRTLEFLSQRILGPILSSGGTRSIINDSLLNDYQIGAPAITQLNNTPLQPNIVRVAFYGAEVNSQSFLRTLQYMAKPSQTLPAFTATNDKEESETIALATSLRNDLENTAIAKENEANNTNLIDCWYLVLRPLLFYPCLATRLLQSERINGLRGDAAKLRKGYQWLDNSNAQWLGIIGGSTQTTTTTGRCYCSFNSTPISAPTEAICLNIGGCYRWEPIITTTITNEDNDGVVTRSSALAMPGAISLTDADARMEGSQHMQMRNDPNTRAKLLLLYTGQIHPFFTTN
jgi:hypothetical protein